jgi:acetyl esterase
MPVDPRIQALLDKGTGVPATHTLPVDMARAQYEAEDSRSLVSHLQPIP